LQVLNLRRMASVIQCRGPQTRALVSDYISVMKAQEPWHVPIFQALLVGEIAVCIPAPGQSLPIKLFDKISEPVVVMINDDGPFWLGPDGWACAERALRWARGAMLHGAGGEIEHYKLALAGAMARRRFLIVGTSSTLLPAWEQLTARLISDRHQVLSVRVSPGCVHPTDAEMGEASP
jgi:hypothetical protein